MEFAPVFVVGEGYTLALFVSTVYDNDTLFSFIMGIALKYLLFLSQTSFLSL